eukprot:TRINITY_DN78917_c0_g1_i1.p1 TRINITY_DN78917_c0_g1~~TRINITY_DN78917_c0_g1_i1.p1  ORF type:complete len:100 (+),score=18.46 TRINITY_DN78917_c0_g1_i1:73-372(+)
MYNASSSNPFILSGLLGVEKLEIKQLRQGNGEWEEEEQLHGDFYLFLFQSQQSLSACTGDPQPHDHGGPWKITIIMHVARMQGETLRTSAVGRPFAMRS